MDEKQKHTLLLIGIILIVLLTMRAFWLWFWKINFLESNLEEMNIQLKTMTEALQAIQEQTK